MTDPFMMMRLAASGQNYWRNDVFREEFDNITIDTCNTPDDGWETGIERDGNPWVIVQYYDSREEAQKGHNEWVTKLRENRNIELPDVQGNFWEDGEE